MCNLNSPKNLTCPLGKLRTELAITQDFLCTPLFDHLFWCNSSIIDRLGSFSVEINSSIPVGAGLGSSASYSVCLVTALLAAMEAIPSDQETTTATLSVAKGEGTISLPHQDLALICNWSLEAEKLVHGNPSGVDNSICTYGMLKILLL